MHAALFGQFAGPCTVQRGADAPVATRCIKDDGVGRLGQYGQVIGRVSKISFIKSEWDPARGDVVTLDGAALKIEAIDNDDGYIVEAVLHG